MAGRRSTMPLTLYKYLPAKYAELFISKGEVLFRSLLFFQAWEHEERGDELEGTQCVLIRQKQVVLSRASTPVAQG